MKELTRNLKITQGEVADLSQQLRQLQSDKKNNEVTIKKPNEDLASEKLVKNLDERCNYQGYSRRNNLYIVALKKRQNETCGSLETIE